MLPLPRAVLHVVVPIHVYSKIKVQSYLLNSIFVPIFLMTYHIFFIVKSAVHRPPQPKGVQIPMKINRQEFKRLNYILGIKLYRITRVLTGRMGMGYFRWLGYIGKWHLAIKGLRKWRTSKSRMGNGSRYSKRTWRLVWFKTHKAKRTIRGRSETELGKDRSWACQSELTRQQYPLFCLSLGISSSFPLIISTQLDAQICYINPAVFLFFSVVSKPLCKAKLTLTLHSTIPFKAHILPHLPQTSSEAALKVSSH